MALMCGMMVSCTQCSTAAPENDQTAMEDTAVIVKNDYFHGILLKIWPTMNKKYPDYAFYEASGHLKKLEKDSMWGVDHNTFSATYNSLVRPASVVAYVEVQGKGRVMDWRQIYYSVCHVRLNSCHRDSPEENQLCSGGRNASRFKAPSSS